MTRTGLIAITLIGMISCAGVSPVQVAQTSHDAIAVAQDNEATLCWGVASVQAAIAANLPPGHCTATAAASVGLTDERHQQFNALIAPVLSEHRRLTTALAAGVQVDFTTLRTDIAALIAWASSLVQTDATVSTLRLNLQKASPK